MEKNFGLNEYYKSKPNLNVQELALARAMYEHDESLVTQYKQLDNDTKEVYKLDESLWPELVKEYYDDQKDFLGYGRLNLLAINKDKKISPPERRERVSRYLDALLSLQIKLDHEAFPADHKIRSFVPMYVPDGLKDYGQDPNSKPEYRNREKILVNKENIFKNFKPLFQEIFFQDWGNLDLESWKQYVVKRTAIEVYNKMPYNYGEANKFQRPGETITISDVVEKKLSVCRHHALMTQVLLQTFGITSRLLKCKVNFEGDSNDLSSHAANLVRVDYKWYLLDSTNPDSVEGGDYQVFMKQIPEKEIDLNRNIYTWSLERKKNKKKFIYRSHNKMYFELADIK
jgi:hypothetical protein